MANQDFDRFVQGYKRYYNQNADGYTDTHGRTHKPRKPYNQMTRDDVRNMDLTTLQVLDDMVLDNSRDGNDHLRQTMPDCYHGDLDAYKRDIHQGFQNQGGSHMSYNTGRDERGGYALASDDQRPKADPRDGRREVPGDYYVSDRPVQANDWHDHDRKVGQADWQRQSLEVVSQAAQMPKITLLPVTEVTPVALKGIGGVKAVAAESYLSVTRSAACSG